MNKRKRPSWYKTSTPTARRSAVGGNGQRMNRECRECFGFPYHAKGCPKAE